MLRMQNDFTDKSSACADKQDARNMTSPRIIKLDADGPGSTGLIRMELDPADFQSDLPDQFWHVYHEDEAIGLYVGVWTTTSMQETFGPYPGNEFMCLLEGQVSMMNENNQPTVVNPGETFCIRNGVPTSWKQVGSAHKLFVIYAPPDGPAPAIGAGEAGIQVLRPNELSPHMVTLETTAPFDTGEHRPVQKDANCFRSDDGKMTAGMWESTPFESAMAPFPCHEFVQLLEGSISITEEAGNVCSFSAGDVFFIPRGSICSWKVIEPVRKLYCIVDAGS